MRSDSKPGSVAITGATGFLGWHLAEAFRGAGWRVRALVRPGNARPLPAGIESREVPLEAAALTPALEGCAVVIHAAALIRARDDRAFHAVNVAGTEAVVAAANSVGARVILISSQAVAGVGTPDRPSREDDPPRPLNGYGRSKLAAEEVVKARASLPWTIVRPSAVYGPRDRQFLPLFRLASHGIFLLVANPSLPFTLIYVEDVARAIVRAAGLPGEASGAAGADGPGGAGGAGRVLFLGHAQPQTTEDLLRGLADVFHRPYKPRQIPGVLVTGLSWLGELSWRLGKAPLVDRDRLGEYRAAGFVCAVDRARDLLGFSASVGLSEGIDRTARWYREHGWM